MLERWQDVLRYEDDDEDQACLICSL